ncbi:MAG: hypothetical protein WAQ28_13630 [Bacteroidia bacterium]
MDNYIMAYITQRMTEMGFPHFHFEPVRILENSTRREIMAYNEFYYLLNKLVPASLVIASDINIFNEAANYNDYTFYRVQEFSGLIEISQAIAPIDLQFLKVIPTTCN